VRGLYAGVVALWENRSVRLTKTFSFSCALTFIRLKSSVTIENVAARDPSSSQLIVSPNCVPSWNDVHVAKLAFETGNS
jgi:hypothetical protein